MVQAVLLDLTLQLLQATYCRYYSHSKQWNSALNFPVKFFMHSLSAQDALFSILFPTNYQENATSLEYIPIKRNITTPTPPLCKLISTVHDIIKGIHTDNKKVFPHLKYHFNISTLLLSLVRVFYFVPRRKELNVAEVFASVWLWWRHDPGAKAVVSVD